MSALRKLLSRHGPATITTLAGLLLAVLNAILGDGSPADVETIIEGAALAVGGFVAGLAGEQTAISRRTVNEAIDSAKEYAEAYIPETVLDQLDDAARRALLEAVRAGLEGSIRLDSGVKPDQR